MRWTLLLLLALAAGCGAAAEDFENICNAVERSGAADMEDGGEKQARIAEWISRTIKTGEARRAFQSLATASPAARGDLLRLHARRAGYTGPCPIADL